MSFAKVNDEVLKLCHWALSILYSEQYRRFWGRIIRREHLYSNWNAPYIPVNDNKETYHPFFSFQYICSMILTGTINLGMGITRFSLFWILGKSKTEFANAIWQWKARIIYLRWNMESVKIVIYSVCVF